MANVIATYTSGLVLGSGAVYAFVSHFTDQSRAMSYKLRWASEALREADTSKGQTTPAQIDTKPEAISKYRQITSRLSDNAIPLAKKEWNSTVALAVRSVNNVDMDANQLVSMWQKQYN
ncbi:hypothetical protein IW146_000536 [Coemansia sp. RSA 922]|nr:hypothetical protein GGI08_006780 [Coemansia sp. S2]KAJ2053908.1 hypothetical protein H4S04_000377 [Coemansia sp. S16]KAJ2117689.1 hypothetical protein IW146_000536 [Coemansia sp. RSA 922]KAJ2327015.1 hypothetical protein GGH92_010134 [Coemansia sp. RSA 2673]